MTVRPLVILPDPLLRKPSEPVQSVTPEIRTLAADMLETMYDAPGIGLAAVQIGVMKRVVVIDLAKPEEEKTPVVFINPEVIWESEETNVHEEGCLSIPDYYEEVERPERVTIRYMDLDGRMQDMAADGLMATCIQHEIDHLDGVLFIDYLSRLKRDRVTRKFAKAARREAEG
jgi:peptide deformylase